MKQYLTARFIFIFAFFSGLVILGAIASVLYLSGLIKWTWLGNRLRNPDSISLFLNFALLFGPAMVVGWQNRVLTPRKLFFQGLLITVLIGIESNLFAMLTIRFWRGYEAKALQIAILLSWLVLPVGAIFGGTISIMAHKANELLGRPSS